MARGNMRPQPWLKNIEIYNNFVGGLNTVDNSMRMSDTEAAELVNMDITARGTLQRRHGMVHHERGALWRDVKGMTWKDLNGG